MNAIRPLPQIGQSLELPILRHNPALPVEHLPSCLGYCDCRFNEYRTMTMTVEKVLNYADNSCQVYGILDDGTRHMEWLAVPSGDRCF